jgi:hypothetical protein
MSRWLLFVGVAVLWASPAHADFIDFTQLSYAPSETIVIGGVTITGEGGSLVGIVAGQGLGIEGGGSIGTIDRGLAFATGSWDPVCCAPFDGDVLLETDGFVNAITIQPYLTAVGLSVADLDTPYFEISYPADGFSNYHTVSSLLATTITWNVVDPFIMNMGVRSDFGQDQYFRAALERHGLPAASFSFGYSIVSMDYTPTHVSEPSTLSLLGLVAALGACLRVRLRVLR